MCRTILNKIYTKAHTHRLKNKAVKILDTTEDIILVGMFVAMVAIIFIQVIMRYVFDNSLSWSEELGKFLFVWLSWFGISIGARRGEHIKITMLTDRLPFHAAQFTNIISDLVMIGILLVTAYYGITLVSSQAATHYAGIKISMSWGYLAVVVGCLMMTIRVILSIVTSFSALKNGPVPESKGGNI